MKTIAKFGIGILLIIVFSGCGEAFRGQNSFNLDDDFGNDEFSQTLRGFGASDNATRDNEILMSYQSQFSSSREEIENLNESFKAFDLLLTAASNNRANVRARMALGCGDGLQFEATVPSADLQSGQKISLGRTGDYRVEVQCNKANCNQMVAAISKVAGADRGLILMGLEVGGRTGETQILYKHRPVNLYPFFAQMEYEHVSAYESDKNCTVISNGGSSENEDRSIFDVLVNGDESDLIDLGKDWLLDYLGR